MATCIPLQAQRCAAAATANRPATLGLGGRGWGLAYGFCPLLCSIYLSRRGWPCARQAQVNFTRAGGGAVAVPCLRTLPITTHDRIVGRYAVAYTAYPVDPPLVLWLRNRINGSDGSRHDNQLDSIKPKEGRQCWWIWLSKSYLTWSKATI